MNLDLVRDQLSKAYLDAPLVQQGLRQAAVLLPMTKIDQKWHLLYTRRSDTVMDHKGQVSFPGGAVENFDKSVEEAALREAYEEIGLLPQDAVVLGRISPQKTITGYFVHPVVAVIPWPYIFCPSEEEVARIFSIPIDWLSDPINWHEEPRRINEQWIENVIHYNDFDCEHLWGITARLTQQFLDIIKKVRL